MQPKEIIRRYPPEKKHLLMLLHALQDEHPQHYLSSEALEIVADYLGMTRGAVYGVAKYYSMFSLQPRGSHIIRVCVSAVCELVEGREVMASLERELGIEAGQTTPCGLFTLEVSECLGQCQEAPAMMINDEVHAGLDAEKTARIIRDIRQKHTKTNSLPAGNGINK